MGMVVGMVGGEGFASELRGDSSLRKRPMDRVVEPLTAMGAEASWPPLRVGGRGPLRGIEYRPPLPSAQVKSAGLLAGLFADGVTEGGEKVARPGPTGRMLAAHEA